VLNLLISQASLVPWVSCVSHTLLLSLLKTPSSKAFCVDATPNDVVDVPPDVLHCEFIAVVAIAFISGPNSEHRLPALSNGSYHYSVNSVNSYKSRKNVLYPRRVHPPPATLPPVKIRAGMPWHRFLRTQTYVFFLVYSSLFSSTVASYTLHRCWPGRSGSLRGLVAMLGDPSIASGKSTPWVFGERNGSQFATQERRNPLLLRTIHHVDS
jgi:hypothetical protein